MKEKGRATPIAPRGAAFTLIEMIAVMAIVIILIGTVVPAVTSNLKGSQLSQAYRTTIGELNSARQTALGKNRSIEVRFYLYDNPPTAGGVTGYTCRAFQSWTVQVDGTLQPLSKINVWPVGIVISARPESSDANSSSIVPRGGNGLVMHPTAGEVLPTLPSLPGTATTMYKYLAFQFRPDGSTTFVPPLQSSDNGNSTTGLAANPKLWYFTLCNEHDPVVNGSLPANYATIQIDPYTGDMRTFRP